MKYWPSIGATVLILIAVLWPGSNIPRVDYPHFDKWVHVTMFTVWALAVRLDFPQLRHLQLLALGISFGLFTEFIQYFTEHRSFDIFDFVADSVGITIGYFLSPLVARVLKKN